MSIVTGNNMGDVRSAGGAWWDVKVNGRGRVVSVEANAHLLRKGAGDEIVTREMPAGVGPSLVCTVFAGGTREAAAKVEGMIVREIARSIMEVEWG